MNTNLINRFSEYLLKYGISNNKAATAVGYTAGVISQWRRGEYKGNVEEVDAKVTLWLDLQEARIQAGAVPFVPLKRTERIKTAVRIAHEEKVIGLILGNSGTGKSRALDEYAQCYPNTILVKCDPAMGLSTVIVELARSMGLDTKGRLSEISERLVAELGKRDFCVIFDEADYLTDNVMEWVRIAINDKGRSALVFAGLPKVEYRIKSLRADHRQLENRVGIMLHVDEVDPVDIHEILAAVWPSISDEAEKVFVQVARMSLHLLVNHIALVRRGLRQAPGIDTPTAAFATECSRFLMR